MNFSGSRTSTRSTWWSVLSIAFSKSLKFRYRDVWNPMDCSIILRRVAIWSAQDFPFLNPACSSRNLLSTCTFILSSIIILSTWLGMDSGVIPLQFLQKLVPPLFGSFTSSPTISEISSVVQRVLNRSYNMSMDVCPPAFKASGGMLSDPAALPFFSIVSARLISSILMLPVLIGNWWLACSSGVSRGGSLLALLQSGYTILQVDCSV